MQEDQQYQKQIKVKLFHKFKKKVPNCIEIINYEDKKYELRHKKRERLTHCSKI